MFDSNTKKKIRRHKKPLSIQICYNSDNINGQN